MSTTPILEQHSSLVLSEFFNKYFNLYKQIQSDVSCVSNVLGVITFQKGLSVLVITSIQNQLVQISHFSL